MVSAPPAIASASANSSFRTLLPPNPNGIASSRLTNSLGTPRPPRTARNRDISSTGVGPANREIRGASSIATLFLRRGRTARARHLIGADLRRVEPSCAGEHLVDRLVEVGGRLALEAQWIEASNDE